MLSAEPTERRRGQQLLFGAGLAAGLFTFPLLGIWDRDVRVLGVPVLYVGLLLMWGLLVAFTGWVVRRPVADLAPPAEPLPAPPLPPNAPDRRA